MTNEFYGHMNIWQNIKVKNTLEKMGAADENTKFMCTHISHFGGKDTHEYLGKIAADNGLILAYDGLEVEI